MSALPLMTERSQETLHRLESQAISLPLTSAAWHFDDMIDLGLFRTSKLSDLKPGTLFVPVVEGASHFLAGRINDYPVLVELDGEDPFLVATTAEWSRAPGLVVETIRFQVEAQAAVPVQSAHDAEPGSLVLTGAGNYLLAHDVSGRHAVLLADGQGPTGLERGDVGFPSWQIVTGEAPNIEVHFQQPRR